MSDQATALDMVGQSASTARDGSGAVRNPQGSLCGVAAGRPSLGLARGCGAVRRGLGVCVGVSVRALASLSRGCEEAPLGGASGNHLTEVTVESSFADAFLGSCLVTLYGGGTFLSSLHLLGRHCSSQRYGRMKITAFTLGATVVDLGPVPSPASPGRRHHHLPVRVAKP